MYSAVVLGWPATTIRPSRFTSTPTEIMFVASRTSIGFCGISSNCLALASSRRRAFAAGSKGASSRSRIVGICVEDLREVSSWRNSTGNRRGQAPAVHLAEAVADVVVDEAPHPAELAHRVEVADQGHPGVGVVPVAVEEGLGRRQEGDIDADQGRLQSSAGGADADVAAPGVLVAGRPLEREEVVVPTS